ncbi:MAG: ATP-binding protein, partial [Chloroflexales bacterium]|nr:ATP-binding protein [Chloroflexales bacterium]
DIEVLQLFAGQAVIAIQNADNYTRAERGLLRFRLLHQAGRELGEIADLAELERAYDIVIQVARTYSDSQVIIRRYNADSRELTLDRYVKEHPIIPTPHFKIDEGLNGRVARERKTKVIPDLSRLPLGIHAKLSGPLERSVVIAPLLFRGYYYGNLTLIHKETNRFLDTDVELIEGLAIQLAITIHRLEVTHARQEAEQRAAEAEVMSSIGQVAFELAHRLDNNLGLIRSYSNNIRLELETHGLDNPTITTNLDKIVQDVGKVLALSKGLKAEFKNILGDTASPQQRMAVPVRDFLEEVVYSYPNRLNNIQVVFEVVSDVSPVYIAPAQFRRIVYNLYVNALQAMPEGGTITFRAINAGRYVEIQVADTGVGIAPANVPKIFDLFYTTKVSSGFGLWSAKRYVLENNGVLTANSQLGQGTVFKLFLPRADIET